MTYELELTKPRPTNGKMRLVNKETKTYAWGEETKPQTPERVPLTLTELKALQKAHKSTRINVERAERVKMLLILDQQPSAIYRLLRSKGKGYGRTMIATDCATLSNK